MRSLAIVFFVVCLALAISAFRMFGHTTDAMVGARPALEPGATRDSRDDEIESLRKRVEDLNRQLAALRQATSRDGSQPRAARDPDHASVSSSPVDSRAELQRDLDRAVSTIRSTSPDTSNAGDVASGAPRDGWAQTYHPNGRVESAGMYQDGKRIGTWTDYDPDGHVILRGVYLDGKATGAWDKWDEKGTLIAHGWTLDGHFHGTCLFWNSDGSPDEARSGTYVNGQRVGK